MGDTVIHPVTILGYSYVGLSTLTAFGAVRQSVGLANDLEHSNAEKAKHLIPFGIIFVFGPVALCVGRCNPIGGAVLSCVGLVAASTSLWFYHKMHNNNIADFDAAQKQKRHAAAVAAEIQHRKGIQFLEALEACEPEELEEMFSWQLSNDPVAARLARDDYIAKWQQRLKSSEPSESNDGNVSSDESGRR